MGSKTSSQQNQNTSTYALPWAAHNYDTVEAKATAAANLPYQAYQGELTAGTNSAEAGAYQQYGTTMDKTQGYLDTATSQANQATGAVNPTALNGAAIQQYESPYQSDVINATMAQAQNQDAIQNQQNISNSIGAGAFGGDRAGIAQGVLQGQQALANNATLSNLNNSNYAQALSTAQQQQGVGLGAAQANRAALAQASGQLQNIAGISNSTNLADANANLGYGVLQQQTQQAGDTAQYGQFEQAQAFPYVQSNFLAGITDATSPLYGSESYGQQTTSTNSANSILGGGLGILGLFSDKRLKTDIQPVGKSFDGQTLYSFRYKDDPRAVHVGLLAQEVEKHAPDAVGSHRGAKVVDYGEALRRSADKGHFARGGATGLGALRYANGGTANDADVSAFYDAFPSQNRQSYWDDGASTMPRGWSDSIPSVNQAISQDRVTPEDDHGFVAYPGADLYNGQMFADGGSVGFGALARVPRFAQGGSPYNGEMTPYGSQGAPYSSSSSSYVPASSIKPAQVLNNPMHFSSSSGQASAMPSQSAFQKAGKGVQGLMGAGGGFTSSAPSAPVQPAVNDNGGGLGALGGAGGGGGLGGLFSSFGFERGGVVGRRGFADGGSPFDQSDDDDDKSGGDEFSKSYIPDNPINPAKPLDNPMQFSSPSSVGGGGGGSSGGSKAGGGGLLSMFGLAQGGVAGRRGYDGGGTVDDDAALMLPDVWTPEMAPDPVVPKVDDVPLIKADKSPTGYAPPIDPAPDKTDASSVPVPLTPNQLDALPQDGQSVGAPSQGLGAAPDAPLTVPVGASLPTDNAPMPPARPQGLGAMASTNADPANGPITDPNAPPVSVYPASGPGAYAGNGPAPSVPQTGGVTGNGDPSMAYANPDAASGAGGASDGLGAINRAAPMQPSAASWNGSYSDKPGMESYIRATAAKNGIDPEAAIAVYRKEGALGYTGDGGSSHGPFQLHYGGVNPAMPHPGMGDDFTKATGLDARDPATTKAQIDFALAGAAKNGWGAWSGARNMGLTGQMGIGGTPIPADVAARFGNTASRDTFASKSPYGGIAGTSPNDAASRGVLRQAGDDLTTVDHPPTKLSDYFGPAFGGSGTYSPHHSGGLFGLLPGMKDDDRMALAALGFGMAASPSKSFGMALGEGGLQAVKTLQGEHAQDRENALAKAQVANVGSEIGTRQSQQGIEKSRVDLAQQELSTKLDQIREQIRASQVDTGLNTTKTGADVREADARTYNLTHEMTPYGILAKNPSDASAAPTLIPYSSLNGGAALGGQSQKDADGSDKPVVEASGFVHPDNRNIVPNPMTFTPQGKAQVEKLSNDTMEGARTQYEKSQGAKMSLDQMSHALAGIPSTGFLTSGPGQQERAKLAANLNTIGSMFGLSKDSQIDPNAIGSTEEAKKLSFRMGGDLATSFGGREPGFIIQQSVGAVPSSENTPMGAQRIVAGLRAVAQRQEDRYRFLTEYAQHHGGDVMGADDAFNKANPPQRYVGQAVLSTVDPRDLDALRKNKGYGPLIDKKYGAGTAAYAAGG